MPQSNTDRMEQRFGNGTTALYVSIKSLGLEGRRIAVPAPSCPSVPAAILASGNVPVFVDIEPERHGIDPDSLATVIGKVSAVIAIHAYGVPCKLDQVSRVCRDAGVPLIEDCAQAEGAVYQGQSVGNSGDIAVFSYGAGKIIDAGGGGLAVTSNAEMIARIEKENAALPQEKDPNAAQELGAFFKFLYNQFYPYNLEFYREAFSDLLKTFGDRLKSRFDPALEPAIQSGLNGLDENIETRWRNVERYRERLGGDSRVTLLNLPEGSAPWRFNVWIENGLRDRILKKLIQEGLPISSWYPDISRFMKVDSGQTASLDNARHLESGILNFWVAPQVTVPEIDRVCDRFLQLLESGGV